MDTLYGSLCNYGMNASRRVVKYCEQNCVTLAVSTWFQFNNTAICKSQHFPRCWSRQRRLASCVEAESCVAPSIRLCCSFCGVISIRIVASRFCEYFAFSRCGGKQQLRIRGGFNESDCNLPLPCGWGRSLQCFETVPTRLCFESAEASRRRPEKTSDGSGSLSTSGAVYYRLLSSKWRLMLPCCWASLLF